VRSLLRRKFSRHLRTQQNPTEVPDGAPAASSCSDAQEGEEERGGVGGLNVFVVEASRIDGDFIFEAPVFFFCRENYVVHFFFSLW